MRFVMFGCLALLALLSVMSCKHVMREGGSNSAGIYPVREPVRLPTGEPMVAIYFFTHWWEPWKSDDQAIYDDLVRLKEMGFNTILLDSEASQAMPGDFELLSRGHRIAEQVGMKIVPWLSLKCWSAMTSEGRRKWSEERYGASVDVTAQGFLPYGPGTIDFATEYTKDYLKRFKDEALLHVQKDGRSRPVVALTVEAAWHYRSSFDPKTRLHFCRWVRQKYGSLESINEVWGTAYQDVFQIDPSDTTIFDYEEAGNRSERGISCPVRDHIEFRAALVSDAHALMAAKVREDYPEALIAVEIPYAFADEHPHAWGFTVAYASIREIADHADIVMLRGTGRIGERGRQAIADYIDTSGKPVVMLYRIAPGQGPGHSSVADEAVADLFAREAAAFCSGLGYYSWNEMVDVHIVGNAGTNAGKVNCNVSEKDHQRLVKRVGAINKEYLRIYQEGMDEIEVPEPALREQGLPVIY